MRNAFFSRLFGKMREERKIVLVAAVLLVAISLLSAGTIFGIFFDHAEVDTKESLLRELTEKTRLIRQEIENTAEQNALEIRKDIYLQQLAYQLAGRDDPAAVAKIGEILDAALGTGKISAIGLYDVRGNAVAEKGKPIKPVVETGLRMHYRAALMWNREYILRLTLPLTEKKGRFGEIRMEMPLPAVTEAMRSYAALGETGEIVLCAATAKNRMQCFPSRHRPHGFETSRTQAGKPLPVSHALDSESGVITTDDYRDRSVIVAVKPVGDLGLGMAQKIDAAELRRPMLDYLLWVLPVLVVLSAVGVVLMRWALGPLLGALLSSRTYVRAILDNAAEAVITFDADDAIESINPAALKMFGYDPAEVIGQSVKMLVALPYHDALDRHVRIPIPPPATGAQAGKEIAGRRKDGTTFLMEFTASRMTLNGEPRFVVVARDVTERVRAERAVRESEKSQRRLAEQQTSILEALPASIALLDKTGTIITANQSWWQFFRQRGFPDNKFHPGSSYLEICDAAGAASATGDPFALSGGLHAVLAGERAFFTLEYPAHLPDRQCWQKMVVSPLAPGKSEGVVVMHMDVTERRLAEEARSRFTSLIEATTDFIGMAYPDGRVFYANQALRRIRGIGENEDVSHTRIAGYHPEWAARMIANEGLPKAAAAGSWSAETAILDAGGNEIPVLQVVLAHKGADGKADYYSTIMRDISQRKLSETLLMDGLTQLQRAYDQLEDAQTQLLQSEKMASIGQLAAGVAHEINNPVGYVQSNLGSLEKYLADLFALLNAYEQAEGDETALPAIRELKRQVDLDFLREDVPTLVAESREGIARVKQIVQNLKDFSRIDASDSWMWADLHKGLDSTVNIANNEIKYKADVFKEYGQLPEVECLPSQLNQVFMNLLVNAAQAMDAEGGKRGLITIRTGASDDRVWVEIADTGKGIAPEHLNRIFEPFFTTKPVGKGTGLGLSLSYGIVQKHRGRIEVQSEPGRGTTFRVWLPVNQTSTGEGASPRDAT